MNTHNQAQYRKPKEARYVIGVRYPDLYNQKLFSEVEDLNVQCG